MKRWHLTLGLAGTALVAAALAPRLQALFVPPLELVEPPDVVQIPDPPPPAVSQGRLVVDAGLDRTAVLKGSPSERFLTITLTAPEGSGDAVRAPVNVAVVMDASGSMSAAGKITYAKDAAKAVVSAMQPGDAFSLVTFSDDASVIVPATDVTDGARLHRQIDRVYEGGGTNLFAGMNLGDREIQRVLDAGEVGRLIVLSDGNANVGVTDPDVLARFAHEASERGIAVSAMGLGVDYNEDLLARVADMGGGTYDYIDDPRELASVFSAELQRTSTVVTRNTAVTIELPEGVVPLDVLGWDAVPTGNGWTLYAGDLYAGTTRKIIARVRVTGDVTGPLPVAAVRADYIDVLDGTVAQSSDRALATITSDPNQVEASFDVKRAAAANRAWGNHHLQMSTKAYANGDMKGAASLLHNGSNILRSAAKRTGDVVLERDAAQLDEQEEVYLRNAPTSPRGRRAIKMNKEIVRGASR